MKREVNKLIELAKEYVEYGKLIDLPNTHNIVRPESEGSISIYFADEGKTWSITFKDVEVKGYTQCISMPFTCTTLYLRKVYRDALNYLNTVLLPNIKEKEDG